MAIPDVLRDLLAAAGPSGSESAPTTVFRDACSGFAEVSSDLVGSAVARVPGKGEAPSLAIYSHADEIGLMVSHVDDDGFLWFLPVGGWDPVILVGQRVTVLTREGPVAGVIGKKPIHLLREDERKKVPELREMHIDVGAASGDEARGLVSVGDVAVIAAEPLELRNDRLAGRALDNRLGMFVAYEAARLVAEAGGAPGDVLAVATAQEEITGAGATTSAFSLEPDLAIVVDVTHATDAPGIEEKENGRHAFGSGPVLVRGPVLAPAIFEGLRETAEAEGIEFTVEATSPKSWTDADAVFVSRGGVPTGLIGIPLRYMHSPVEMVALPDVLACARLIAAYAQRLSAGTSFAR